MDFFELQEAIDDGEVDQVRALLDAGAEIYETDRDIAMHDVSRLGFQSLHIGLFGGFSTIVSAPKFLGCPTIPRSFPSHSFFTMCFTPVSEVFQAEFHVLQQLHHITVQCFKPASELFQARDSFASDPFLRL